VHLVFHKEPSCLLVKVTGDLDLSTVSRFKEGVEQELRKTGVPNLVLNLRSLSFIDSTGLGAILGRHKEVTARGGRMILTEVPPKVLSMLEMAGLSSVLTIVRGQDEALRICEGSDSLGERRS